MEIIKIDPINPEEKVILKAAKIIEDGGVVVHPTDTAYGLAGNIFNEAAISKIYDLKGRSLTKGLIVCIKDLKMATTLVEFTLIAEKLFNHFLPGPLTLLLPKKDIVSDKVTGGSNALAIRLPKNNITSSLSASCLVPYTTTSANLSGSTNPYSLEDILREFDEEHRSKIDLVLDAGTLPHIPPSTLVDLTSKEPKILREGPISSSELFSFLKQP